MPIKKLKTFLDKEGVKYVSISHSPAYTMPEIAAKAHVPGKMAAKTVMVKIDGNLAMIVLPSNEKVDLKAMTEITGSQVALATEQEFKGLFPECELGAMPPFGNLYGLDVYVSPHLERYDEIAFNAGTHTELIKLAYTDFERLVHPKVLTLT